MVPSDAPSQPADRKAQGSWPNELSVPRCTQEATRRILHWAADPRVDAILLRKAVDETLDADALTPPLSHCLKLGYLITMREIDELSMMGLDAPLPGGEMGLAEKVIGKSRCGGTIQRFRLRARTRSSAEPPRGSFAFCQLARASRQACVPACTDCAMISFGDLRV